MSAQLEPITSKWVRDRYCQVNDFTCHYGIESSSTFRPSDQPKARQFCDRVMREYGFTDIMRNHILSTTIFTVDNWDSVTGGGWANFGYRGITNWVQLNTAQIEAAIHECAHIGWKEMDSWPGINKDYLVAYMTEQIYRLAYEYKDYMEGRLQYIEFERACNLCYLYIFGHDNWPGMCPDGPKKCNHNEFFAGLASGLMGMMIYMPYALRRVFEIVFNINTIRFPSWR